MSGIDDNGVETVSKVSQFTRYGLEVGPALGSKQSRHVLNEYKRRLLPLITKGLQDPRESKERGRLVS
ncbi:MAG: hypothetical protein V3T53_15985 [Phycisphaerales bacterium]